MFYDTAWVQRQAESTLNEDQFDVMILQMRNEHKITDGKELEFRQLFRRVKKEMAEGKRFQYVGIQNQKELKAKK